MGVTELADTDKSWFIVDVFIQREESKRVGAFGYLYLWGYRSVTKHLTQEVPSSNLGPLYIVIICHL